MKKEELVTERPSMLKMTWPIFIELALQIFVGYIDQFMISRFDETLVGAVTNATQILNLVILVFSVVSTATTILIVQHLGAKEYGKLSEIYTLCDKHSFLVCNKLIAVFACAEFCRMDENTRQYATSFHRLYADCGRRNVLAGDILNILGIL